MPAGRPFTVTEKTKKTIAELMWLAFTDEQIASFVDLSSKTIQRIRLGQICPEIKRAELKRESFFRKKIWHGRVGWQGAAWALERKYPNQLSRPEVMLQINQQTLNQTTNNSVIISAEVADQVLARVKDANSKVTELFKERKPNNGQSPSKEKE